MTLTNISDGTVSLIATINNNGCISSALKTVHTGNYSPSYMPINGPTEAQCGGNMEFSVQDYPGVTYNWSFPSTWEYYSGQGTAWLSVSVPYNPGVSDGTVSVDIYDACWQNSSWLYVSSCPYYEYYSMSPNPASSTVAVSAKETTAKGEKVDKSITEVNIYDKTGNLKKRQKFGKVKKATLYISDLSPDIYIVEIVDGSYRERKKLSVLR